jgi:hypothetical protein
MESIAVTMVGMTTCHSFNDGPPYTPICTPIQHHTTLYIYIYDIRGFPRIGVPLNHPF